MSSTTHGVLMSAEMILAYKHGFKSQTRRTRGLDEINQNPDDWRFERFVETGNRKRVFVMEREAARFINSKGRFIDVRLPYSGVGKTLWFRETWKMFERDGDGKDFLHYRADDEKVDPTWWPEEEWRRPDPIWGKKGIFEKWQPSLLMPKLCSRYQDVEILNVRVERLQNITMLDCVAEGWQLYNRKYVAGGRQGKFLPPLNWYFDLWDKINGKKLPVSVNPWVFVYEFPKNKFAEAE